MSPEATATGTLQAQPFGHLLVYLLDRAMSGTLVLEEASGEKHAIWFDTGAPAKVKTARPVTYLGQVLVEQRAITREVYERTLQGALHERRLHGQVLIETGAVEPRLVRDALREQLARQVLWLFKLPPSTLYGYYDRVNLLERWGAPEGIRVRPLALIWRGLRKHAPLSEVEAVVARLGERPVELHVDAPIRRFKFEAGEQALIDVLRAKPQPISRLIASGLASPEEVKRLVYVLVILRQLELGVPGSEPVGADEVTSSSRIPIAPAGRASIPGVEGPGTGAHAARASVPDVERVVPRPSGEHQVVGVSSVSVPPTPSPPRSPTPAVSSPPRPVSPSVASPPPSARAASAAPAVSVLPPGSGAGNADLRLELAAIAARLRGTHYEVLGVPADADVSMIQNAFFGLAKKWHPDRLRSDLSDLRDEATRVFARISEASQVLSDPQRRRSYDHSLVTGETQDEVEQVQRVLKATHAFQKAEVLLKRGNLAAAEKEALIAFENDPSQADHVALHAWIRGQKPDANYTDLLVELDKAIKSEPNNLRVRWYRGQLLKRAGRAREALHDFRFIVERDPRHTDAHREVRLHAMRRGSGTPSDAPAGRASSSPAPASGGKPKSTPPKSGGLLNKLFKKP